MFVNALRKILSPNRSIYNKLGRYYHGVLLFTSRINCALRGVRYFSPQTPYGDFSSQFGQDKVLESLGFLKIGGVFVEVGSNHPVLNSNSYYLELHWGYSGISIDPIDYADLFKVHRPKTRFINVAIDKEASSVTLNLVKKEEGWEDQVSSLYDSVSTHGRGFKSIKTVVPADTLTNICNGLEHIDLLMLDVEGHEINVLQSFDWSHSQPDIILVENTGNFYPRHRLERFLTSKGYHLVARVGSSDDIYQRQVTHGCRCQGS
jgi:hypothetical protein